MSGTDVAEESGQQKGERPLTRQEKRQKALDDWYKKLANQERAQLQQVLHRCSALCTLAHGLLLDEAANSGFLQVITVPCQGYELACVNIVHDSPRLCRRLVLFKEPLLGREDLVSWAAASQYVLALTAGNCALAGGQQC